MEIPGSPQRSRSEQAQHRSGQSDLQKGTKPPHSSAGGTSHPISRRAMLDVDREAAGKQLQGQLKRCRRTLVGMLSPLQAPQALAKHMGEPISTSDDGTVTVQPHVSNRASRELHGEPGTGNQLPAQHPCSAPRYKPTAPGFATTGKNSQCSSPSSWGF